MALARSSRRLMDFSLLVKAAWQRWDDFRPCLFFLSLQCGTPPQPARGCLAFIGSTKHHQNHYNSSKRPSYLHLDFLSAAPRILALLTHSCCGWAPLTASGQLQTYPPALHPGQCTPAWEKGKKNCKFCIWCSISPPGHSLSSCFTAFNHQWALCMCRAGAGNGFSLFFRPDNCTTVQMQCNWPNPLDFLVLKRWELSISGTPDSPACFMPSQCCLSDIQCSGAAICCPSWLVCNTKAHIQALCFPTKEYSQLKKQVISQTTGSWGTVWQCLGCRAHDGKLIRTGAAWGSFVKHWQQRVHGRAYKHNIAPRITLWSKSRLGLTVQEAVQTSCKPW